MRYFVYFTLFSDSKNITDWPWVNAIFYHFFSKENDNNVFLAKNLMLQKRFVIADWRWRGHQERKLKKN